MNKLNLLLIILISFLTLSAILMYVFSWNRYHYFYTAEGQEFEVRRISEDETQIMLYIGINETPYIATFFYDPANLEDIKVDPTIKLRLSDDKKVYITSNEDLAANTYAVEASFEIAKFLIDKNLYGIPVIRALSYTNKTLAINSTYNDISCDNSGVYTSVIFLKLNDESYKANEITLDPYNQNCIILNANSEQELVRLADRLAMHILNIMP